MENSIRGPIFLASSLALMFISCFTLNEQFVFFFFFLDFNSVAIKLKNYKKFISYA